MLRPVKRFVAALILSIFSLLRKVLFYFVPVLLIMVMTNIETAASADKTSFLPAITILLAGGSCPDGHVELAGNGIDDNCDGLVDELPETCDNNLLLDEPEPVKAAAAMDICNMGSDTEWGLLSASYERANGDSVSTTVQHGLLSSFGNNTPPQNGKRILYLSTGTARLVGQTGACDDESCEGLGAGVAPAGFPQAYESCPAPTSINDDIALKVSLRAPPNATGFEFSFIFTTFDFPESACTVFNDQFIVQMTPAPQGAVNGNISFDANSNPASVNLGLDKYHCGPDSYGGVLPVPEDYCAAGDSIMDGTGFNEWSANYAGSTGWFFTRAPVTPGSEFTLRFLIWDSGDQTVDSSVVIDNFRWIGGSPTVGTTPTP